jgi:cbb3-type cytochrome oxidase maturation protein
MDIIYLLLPVALIIVLVIIGIFFWAVRSDQFDDLEGPAYRILMDDDDEDSGKTKKPANTPGTAANEKNHPES